MAVRTRTLAAFATGALLAPLLPFAAAPALADGETPTPPEQSIADFCANVPADYEPFTDINGNPFKAAIECLAFAGVTRGGAGGGPTTSYSPDLEVRRGQMATFVAGVMDEAAELDTGNNIRALPAYDGTPQFSDTDGTFHEANIERLADADIVNGGPGGRPATVYDPEGPVTRAQMATFIANAIGYMTGERPSTANDYFTDDDGTHEAAINGITSLGIARGQREKTYNPELPIDRDNMAVFLSRTLGELEERGDIGPAVLTEDIQVTPDTNTTLPATANPDTSAADDRSYAVAGLIPGEEYRVTLVREALVDQNADGETTFTDSDNDNLAETGTPTADITRVNGAAAQNNTGDGTTSTPTSSTNGGTAVAEADNNGRLTFVVDGDASGESVLPVVYRNGGTGNGPEDGGSSPRLQLNDDNTAAEAVDTGGVTTFETTDASAAVTAGPDLVGAEIVRTVVVNGREVTTVRYTFDEAVVAGGIDEDRFFLYTFDGRQITADDDDNTIQDPNDARRDTADDKSVLVVFPLTAEDAADVTLATVTEDAVQDAAGTPNPIGDAGLGSGVSFTAGRTSAPDLVSIGNFRPATTTANSTLVDFTFDEAAFVVSPTAGRFQLVQADGDDLAGQAAENTTTAAGGDFEGDGTATITVIFPNEDTNGDGTASEPITQASIVRGVVLTDTVSNEDQVVNGTPATGDPVEGNGNPLQVTDAGEGGTTTVPDLVSATLDQAARTVTYTFDEDVIVVDPELFRVYDRDGDETPGTAVARTDSDPDDATVVIQFAGTALDAATGASVDEGAVREAGTATTTPVNQEDEVGVASPAVAARQTTGPDLLDVTREITERVTTDPFTGAETRETTGVTIRFLFDDEANLAGNDFFVVSEAGQSTALTSCAREGGTAAGRERVIVCTTRASDDPTTPTVNERAQFEAARDAVLGTVAAGSVTDDEGTANPEGADVITAVAPRA